MKTFAPRIASYVDRLEDKLRRGGYAGPLLIMQSTGGVMPPDYVSRRAVSLLASACLDYFFYPPLLVFSITDPQDWVALSAFELVALAVSKLSSKQQRTSKEAKLHRKAMEQLYELSRNTLLINLYQPPGLQISQLIHRIFDLEAVALFDAESATTSSAGIWVKDQVTLARDSYIALVDDEDASTKIARRVLRVGSNVVGALAIRGKICPLTLNAPAC